MAALECHHSVNHKKVSKQLLSTVANTTKRGWSILVTPESADQYCVCIIQLLLQ